LPVPLKVTVEGLDRSESVTTRFAARAPVAEGPKVTTTVQDEAPGKELPQVLLLSVKSPGFAPVIWSGLNVTGSVPALVTVTVLGDVLPTVTLPKLTEFGLTVMALAVPLKLTDCGLSGSLSTMERLALREPPVSGT
jgi:hypothetical protein